MSYIEKAINDAVDNGWNRPGKAFAYGADVMDDVWQVEDRDELFQMEDIYVIQEAFLDPAFWIALGKARGMDKEAWGSGLVCEYCCDPKCGRGDSCQKDYPRSTYWLSLWLSFIRWLASKKDAESFFEQLYKDAIQNRI